MYSGERIGELPDMISDSNVHPIDAKYPFDRSRPTFLSVLLAIIIPHQKQTNLPLATLGASKVAASGPNSGWTTERLSSTSTRPRRSVIFIEPWTRIVRRWGDPGRLLLLTNALQQQQQCQQQHHLPLQKQMVPSLDCLYLCWISW